MGQQWAERSLHGANSQARGPRRCRTHTRKHRVGCGKRAGARLQLAHKDGPTVGTGHPEGTGWDSGRTFQGPNPILHWPHSACLLETYRVLIRCPTFHNPVLHETHGGLANWRNCPSQSLGLPRKPRASGPWQWAQGCSPIGFLLHPLSLGSWVVLGSWEHVPVPQEKAAHSVGTSLPP